MVWLSHVLHAQSPDECRALVTAAAAALESGERMLIHDFFLAPDQAAPLFPALFSINMMLGTPGGRACTEDQTQRMMTAGIRGIERLPFTGPTEAGILAGAETLNQVSGASPARRASSSRQRFSSALSRLAISGNRGVNP